MSDDRIIRNHPFDPQRELALFEAGLSASGAVVSFTGIVRPGDSSDPVEALELQHHPRLTEPQIAQCAGGVRERFGLEAVLVRHRIGRMAPGDTIVLVAAASAHRREAFEGADALMDWLKTEAMFWKKEWRLSGPQWIEPRTDDYADARRWQEEIYARHQ